MSGPSPTPTKLKIIRGNPGRRKLPPGEPKYDPANPLPPKHLSKSVQAEWRRLVPQFAASGVATTIDYAALVKGFEALDDYNDARKIVKKKGATVTFVGSTGRNTTKKHPAYDVMTDAWKRFVDTLKEFGATPASRSRVAAVKPKHEEDPFVKYEGGRK